MSTTARKFTAAVRAILSEGLASAGIGKVGAAERRATFYATIVAEKVTAAQLVALHNDRTPDAPKKSNDSTVAAIVKAAQLWHDAGANDAILPTASARYAVDRMAAKVTAARKTAKGEALGAKVAEMVAAAKDEARTAARAAKGAAKPAKGAAKGAAKGDTAPAIVAALSAEEIADAIADAYRALVGKINEGQKINADTERALHAGHAAIVAALKVNANA